MTNSCNGCGLCCKLFYINLSKPEYESGKYKTILAEHSTGIDFNKAKSCGANILDKKPDGSCVYETDNQCTIHETRPRACRDFFCTSKAGRFQGMVELIKADDVDGISSVVIDERSR